MAAQSSSSSERTPKEEPKQKEFHIAPMLDVSTQEFCHFMRILTKRAILWTEMVVDDTILHTEHLDHHLPYHSKLSPIVCQIGGRNADSCGRACRVIVESYGGYDEINLNIDCPSSRVSGERKFGAILMHDASAACDVVSAMQRSAKDRRMPISVKCRIGIELDDGEVFDTLDHLIGFIGKLRERGCRKFVIHARKCVIGGLLSPAQNRIVPPLNYPRVYELCRYFPDCEFVLNAGIPGLASARMLCRGKDYESMMEERAGVENGDEDVDAYENVHVGVNANTPTEHDDCSGEWNNQVDSSIGGSNSVKHDTHRPQHGVPCATCNASNGSCVEPPTVAPSNLAGVMIGRACREHPAMFWDVDRYFYGEASNPCRNRREALEEYCLFLESCFPRRCCDGDARKSARIPTPKVEMFTSGGCPICKEFYGDDDDDDYVGSTDISTEERNALFKEQAAKEKLTTAAIGRSLTPIRGLFFGVYGGKCFKTQCDKLAKDRRVRNCGPGYIVRKAMATIPAELLDVPFVKTEDLAEGDVPVHISPSGCHLKRCS